MGAEKPKHWGLFGGTGFIGQHLALSILKRDPEDRVFLLDLTIPSESAWRAPLQPYLDSDRLVVGRCDVRDSTQLHSLSTNFDVIVNLAAVHREPGHRPAEYFETNVPGARNLCSLAEKTGCTEIVFTSSISVYGIHDRPVDEAGPTQPKTPYGQSKLEAEKIHVEWSKRTGGRLSIIRPGVVFGPGEGGNVTRLVREMLNRNRVIAINPDQPKSGIYIKELVEMVHWLRDQELPAGQHQLVNAVSREPHTFNSFGKALGELRTLDSKPLIIPAGLVKAVTSLGKPLAPLIPPGWRFHPERIAKMYRGNDIRATALVQMGYPFGWPLERAMADWLERGL